MLTHTLFGTRRNKNKFRKVEKLFPLDFAQGVSTPNKLRTVLFQDFTVDTKVLCRLLGERHQCTVLLHTTVLTCEAACAQWGNSSMTIEGVQLLSHWMGGCSTGENVTPDTMNMF